MYIICFAYLNNTQKTGWRNEEELGSDILFESRKTCISPWLVLKQMSTLASGEYFCFSSSLPPYLSAGATTLVVRCGVFTFPNFLCPYFYFTKILCLCCFMCLFRPSVRRLELPRKPNNAGSSVPAVGIVIYCNLH